MYQKPDFYHLKPIAKHFESKLKNIKVFLTDVDGILTNGQITWAGEDIGFGRNFHTQDGYGLKLLIQAGLKVGIISGGNSTALKRRIETIGPHYSFLGKEDKLYALEHVLKDAGVKDHEVLYMGDELFDIPLLKRAGFSATVPHSCIEVKEVVDYITTREAGDGCVREVIDLVRIVQNIVPDFLK